MAAYEVLLLNTAIPQIQAAQTGDTYVVPRDIAFSAALTLSAGTANGVPYLNGSKVVTTGSALTFNGTVLAVSSLDTRLTLTSTGSGQTVGISIKGGAGSGDAFNFLESLNNDGTQAWYVGGNGVANTLAFKTNGNNERARITSTGEFQWKPDGTTQAMTLDASGNLLVGTTTSSNRTITVGAASASIALADANGGIYFGATGTPVGSGGFGVNAAIARAGGTNFHISGSVAGDLCIAPEGTKAILFGTSASASSVTERARITSGGDFRVKGAGTAGSTDAFQVSGSAPADAARLDSSGNFLVGTTGLPINNGKLSVSGNSRFYQSASDGAAAITVDKSSTTDTTSQVFVQFTINNQNTGSGQINANGASQAAFGSFSDGRLKQNIVDLPSQWTNIKSLRPVEFDYIQSEGGGHQLGFIAQEVQQVYPDLVGQRADEMLTLSGMGKGEARLIKALQEAMARIETLEAKIAALEAK